MFNALQDKNYLVEKGQFFNLIFGRLKSKFIESYSYPFLGFANCTILSETQVILQNPGYTNFLYFSMKICF